MKVLLLLPLLGLVSCQLGQKNMYPGYDGTTGGVYRAAQCTHWMGVEKSVCHFKGFEVNNKPLKGFTQRNAYYGMMNRNMMGGMQDMPETCSDAPKYTLQCPCSFDEQKMMLNADGTNSWEATSGCATGEETCKKSCNLCGSDYYLVTKKTVEKTQETRCTKLADHYPFMCMEKKIMETQMPSIFSIFLNHHALKPICMTANNQNAMCVSFNYRRRATSECPPDYLSAVSVCMFPNQTYSGYLNTPDTTCENKDAVFTNTAGEDTRGQLNDEGNCYFNIWRKAYFTFTTNGVDCPSALTADSNNENGAVVKLAVYRHVDHFDIDDVQVVRGGCPATNTLDYVNTDTATNAAFIGIKNQE